MSVIDKSFFTRDHHSAAMVQFSIDIITDCVLLFSLSGHRKAADLLRELPVVNSRYGTVLRLILKQFCRYALTFKWGKRLNIKFISTCLIEPKEIKIVSQSKRFIFVGTR